MNILKASTNDISQLMSIFETARTFMKANGNEGQWINGYPQEKLILNEIAQGHCYICLNEQQQIVGTFCYIEGDEPTYNHIEGKWLNSLPYATIHRVASNGKCKGIVNACIAWSKEKINNIRIDTHQANALMQKNILENEFVHCGTIYVKDGSPRIAYQWTR